MTTRMSRVYIASAYSLGYQVENIRVAIDAGNTLADLGFLVYIPHLNFTWHLVYHHEPMFWYEHDLGWLRVCDAVLRLPGESWGADQEVREAERLGIPVFTDIDALVQAAAATWPKVTP